MYRRQWDDWMASVVADPGREGCRDWPFGGGNWGRGRPNVNSGGRKIPVAHIALELDGFPKPEPPADNALHSCDRPSCVAPWHLRWGTKQDNARDRVERGPANVVGERNGQSKLSDDDVREIRRRYVKGRQGAGRGNVMALAEEFDVGREAIRRAAGGVDVWRHVQ